MKSESRNSNPQTVLVVADDPDILIVTQAILAGRGYRTLVANGKEGAVHVLGLKSVDVHSVAIRAGMNGWGDVQEWSVRRGAKPWFFTASVEDGMIGLKGLDSAPSISDLEGQGRNQKALAAWWARGL